MAFHNHILNLMKAVLDKELYQVLLVDQRGNGTISPDAPQKLANLAEELIKNKYGDVKQPPHFDDKGISPIFKKKEREVWRLFLNIQDYLQKQTYIMEHLSIISHGLDHHVSKQHKIPKTNMQTHFGKMDDIHTVNVAQDQVAVDFSKIALNIMNLLKTAFDQTQYMYHKFNNMGTGKTLVPNLQGWVLDMVNLYNTVVVNEQTIAQGVKWASNQVKIYKLFEEDLQALEKEFHRLA